MSFKPIYKLRDWINPDLIVTNALYRNSGELHIIEKKLDKIPSYCWHYVSSNPEAIHIIEKNLPRDEYLEFLQSLDCYVLLSRGEGFSITPREAMALGVPCILSNNTAHKTICDSGYVSWVPCPYVVDSCSFGLGGLPVRDFDCSAKDTQWALRDMYEHYDIYYARAQEGKLWVQRYEWDNVMCYYEQLFYPFSINLGEDNKVGGDGLVTSDFALFEKYKKGLSTQ